ncbi:MAG: hypothetical protein ACRD2L_26595, partial [Terriglobia bacterium]
FLIAASCAGVNFLITAFLMLSLSKLWRARSQHGAPDQAHSLSWRFIPGTLMFAYFATLVANTVRISTALYIRKMPLEISWLNPNQLHRLEGIFIYFGFLLLLFIVSDRRWSAAVPPPVRKGSAFPSTQFIFPLLIYYATTLGIPLANGAYRQGTEFWEHSLFVLLTPLLVILPFAIIRSLTSRRAVTPSHALTTDHIADC